MQVSVDWAKNGAGGRWHLRICRQAVCGVKGKAFRTVGYGRLDENVVCQECEHWQAENVSVIRALDRCAVK